MCRVTRKACSILAFRGRRLWLTGWFWNDLCGVTRPDRDVQAQIKRGYEPEDVRHSGLLPGALGLLRLADKFATCRHMECDRGGDQLAECRRVLSLRKQGKESNDIMRLAGLEFLSVLSSSQ